MHFLKSEAELLPSKRKSPFSVHIIAALLGTSIFLRVFDTLLHR